MPELYPHEIAIMADGYDLTGVLNEASGTLGSTAAERTTFADGGFQNEGTITKSTNYKHHGILGASTWRDGGTSTLP